MHEKRNLLVTRIKVSSNIKTEVYMYFIKASHLHHQISFFHRIHFTSTVYVINFPAGSQKMK